ncbi:hypothetical protein QE400_000045 [Xanthomonas sacchari]|uniref:hypothetical protein n=1 Tax=Xanthomonas sacchari TaxID=56458 RepID=UPI00277D7151|nr:hypothetical protein [Xanthomonas sacchari]MDQ1090632.1 hypothetical protein [Xanthomonas sacchari]
MQTFDQNTLPCFDLFGVQVEVETLTDGRTVIGADVLPTLIQAIATRSPPNLAELQRFSSWVKGLELQCRVY